MKKPRSSRLSMTTKLTQLQRENEALREALETIADVLEEVGILENEEEEEDPEVDIAEIVTTPDPTCLPPNQNPSQHPEDDNPGD